MCTCILITFLCKNLYHSPKESCCATASTQEIGNRKLIYFNVNPKKNIPFTSTEIDVTKKDNEYNLGDCSTNSTSLKKGNSLQRGTECLSTDLNHEFPFFRDVTLVERCLSWAMASTLA